MIAGPQGPELVACMARPRGIAVVGASPRPGSLGERPLRYLRAHGFSGPLYPVNPRHATVAGLACYPSLADVPDPLDVVLVCVPAAEVAAVLAACARRGVGLAVVLSSGFAEAGQAERERELVRAAGPVRLLGPNCQGYLAPGVAATFSAALEDPPPPAAPRAILSQSGALGFSLLQRLGERGLPCAWVVSTGNEADVTLAELAGALPARQVVCYLEAVRDGDRLAQALAEARAAGRVVVAIGGGRTPTGRRAAQAHTAAVPAAGPPPGPAIWVADLDEAGDVLEAFRCPQPPSGTRVAVVSTSGGLGVLLADQLELTAGTDPAALAADTVAALADLVPAFGSPRHPVDVTAQVLERADLLAACLRRVAADPGVDLVLVGLTMLVGARAREVAELLANERLGKPLFVTWTAGEAATATERSLLRAAGIPVFGSPAPLARALRRWLAWHGVTRPVSTRPGSSAGDAR